jgi:hypothetical protein
MHADTPASMTRLARVRRGAVVAVTALAVAALMGACGSSNSSSTSSTPKTNLNTARVAASIKQSILTQRHLKATVVCPTVVAQEKGRTFECIATTRGLKRPFAPITTHFVVTIRNEQGYVTYAGK